jgi:hypothetical protein
MFGGFGFAIPAILATVFTIVIGGMFGILAWVSGLLDRHRDPQAAKLPAAIYTYTVAVLAVLGGIAAVAMVPDAWEPYRIFGERIKPVLYSVFLGMSFLLMLVTVVLLWRWQGRTRGPLLIGSILMVSVDLLTVALFLLSLKGMPLR